MPKTGDTRGESTSRKSQEVASVNSEVYTVNSSPMDKKPTPAVAALPNTTMPLSWPNIVRRKAFLSVPHVPPAMDDALPPWLTDLHIKINPLRPSFSSVYSAMLMGSWSLPKKLPVNRVISLRASHLSLTIWKRRPRHGNASPNTA